MIDQTILIIIIAIVSIVIIMMFINALIEKSKCQTAPTAPRVAREAKPVPKDCNCVNECYSCGSSPISLLSKGKEVTIDPPWQSYPGSNLTDGDYTTFAHSADWIATKDVSAEVDLGKPYTIRKVKIFNRMDCCQDRFGYHQLFIDGKKIGDGNAQGAWEYEYCLEVTGQKVKIAMDGILNLGEIEVWGY